MKRKVLFIAIMVLCSFSATSGIRAQEPEKEKGDEKKEFVNKVKIKLKKEKKDEQEAVTDSVKFYKELVISLSERLDEKDSIAVENTRQMESMKKLIQEEIIKNSSAEAREKELLLAIESRDKEISELRSKEAAVDSGILRLANRLLFERFDKDAVDEGMEFFEKICTGDLKEKYAVVMDLLAMYEGVYLEFQQILKEAQNDGTRTDTYSFAIEPYKNKYIEKLKGMSYYKNYSGEDVVWCIVYLNNEIDKALAILTKHSDTSIADFSSMIDPRF